MKYITVKDATVRRILEDVGPLNDPGAKRLPNGDWQIPVDDEVYEHLQTGAQIDVAIRRALVESRRLREDEAD